MVTEKKLLSSGKEATPCPECNGTNFVIDLAAAMEHWLPTADNRKSFLTNQVWRTKVFYEFDIVFCKDCGLTRHYNFDNPNHSGSNPATQSLAAETSQATSFFHRHKTVLIIIALILFSAYVWFTYQFFVKL